MEQFIQLTRQFSHLSEKEQVQIEEVIIKRINAFQERYSYLLAGEEIVKICLASFYKLDKEISASKIVGTFTKNVKAEIYQALSDSLKESNQVLQKYIAAKIVNVNSRQSAMMELARIEQFLHKLEFYPNAQFYHTLLHDSTIVKNLCQQIFPSAQTRVRMDELFKIQGLRHLTLLEAYCEEEKIQLLPMMNKNGNQKYNTTKKVNELYQTHSPHLDYVKETLLKEYEWLIKRIVRLFFHYGLDFEDLMQEGRIGFIKGMNDYDWTTSTDFVHDVSFAIRTSILDYLAKGSGPIALPNSLLMALSQFKLVKRQLEGELDHDPNPKEIFEKMGINGHLQKQLQLYIYGVQSLDKELATGETTLQDTILDQTREQENCETSFYCQQVRDKFEAYYQLHAKDLEKQIMMLKFGLKDGKCYRTIEIAHILGLEEDVVVSVIENELLDYRRNQVFAQFNAQVKEENEPNFFQKQKRFKEN